MKKIKNLITALDIKQLYQVQAYVLRSKSFFKDLDMVISDSNMLDSDKVILIKTLREEFENDLRL